MSNANIATGLRPINDNGTPWSGQGRMVCFLASYATNVFLGDPLFYTGETDSFGVPVVNLATAGATNLVAGGYMGMTNGPAKGAGAAFTVTRDLPVYRQASVLTYGLIADDPNQLFCIQEDSLPLSTGFIPAANAGMTNGNLIAGAGSTATGFSGWMLDSSTVDGNANTTYQVKIVGLLRGPDNAIGNYAKWIVRLNLPQLWSLTGA